MQERVWYVWELKVMAHLISLVVRRGSRCSGKEDNGHMKQVTGTLHPRKEGILMGSKQRVMLLSLGLYDKVFSSKHF